MLELPKELRQLDEMRLERQEWANRHYPVTEDGLLDRFNPHPKSESQTSPAAEDHSSTLTEPADLTSSQTDQQTMCVPSVGVHTSSNPPAESLSSVLMSTIEGKMSVNRPPFEVLDKGLTGEQVNVMGRGWLFKKEQSSLPVLPSVGRGFLLQKALSQDPKESVGDFKSLNRLEMAPNATNQILTQEEKAQPGCYDNAQPNDKCGSSPQPLSLSLIQSIRSFRI